MAKLATIDGEFLRARRRFGYPWLIGVGFGVGPNLAAALVALSWSGAILVGSPPGQLSLDATKQPSPPARGRGPFPGSAHPGHSAGLPVRLELEIPTGELRPDGTTLVDFLITNVGTEPITLPASVDQNMERTEVLTLWFTSDAIKDAYFRDRQTGRLFKSAIVGTSAELYGRSSDPRTLHVLAPNETMRVHASSRVELDTGAASLTGHAELLLLSNGRSDLVGTADAEPVTKTLSRSPGR